MIRTAGEYTVHHQDRPKPRPEFGIIDFWDSIADYSDWFYSQHAKLFEIRRRAETYHKRIDQMALKIDDYLKELNSNAAHGYQLLEANLNAIRRPLTPKAGHARQSSIAPVGHTPNVGMYLAGNPESMFNWTTIQRPTNIIKIAYSATLSRSTAGDQVAMRGAAIVALLEALENNGYSTLIDCYSYNGFYDVINGFWLSGVRLKDIGQPFNLDLYAKTICNHQTEWHFLFPTKQLVEPYYYRDTLQAEPRKFDFAQLGMIAGPLPLELQKEYNFAINELVYDAFNNTDAAARWITEALKAQGLVLDFMRGDS